MAPTEITAQNAGKKPEVNAKERCGSEHSEKKGIFSINEIRDLVELAGSLGSTIADSVKIQEPTDSQTSSKHRAN